MEYRVLKEELRGRLDDGRRSFLERLVLEHLLWLTERVEVLEDSETSRLVAKGLFQEARWRQRRPPAGMAQEEFDAAERIAIDEKAAEIGLEPEPERVHVDFSGPTMEWSVEPAERCGPEILNALAHLKCAQQRYPHDGDIGRAVQELEKLT